MPELTDNGQHAGDTVSQGSLQAADLSLRSRSDILTLFSKGDTAEATAKPLPPALQSADLPYSDSSDGESSSDGEHSANKDPAEQVGRNSEKGFHPLTPVRNG